MTRKSRLPNLGPDQCVYTGDGRILLAPQAPTGTEQAVSLHMQGGDVRYPKWLTAVKRVMPNACDINEAGCYPYVVVERIGHGLHPFVEGEWWFIFDESSGRYRRAAKPEWAAHISNWALG